MGWLVVADSGTNSTSDKWNVNRAGNWIKEEDDRGRDIRGHAMACIKQIYLSDCQMPGVASDGLILWLQRPSGRRGHQAIGATG